MLIGHDIVVPLPRQMPRSRRFFFLHPLAPHFVPAVPALAAIQTGAPSPAEPAVACACRPAATSDTISRAGLAVGAWLPWINP